MDGILSLHDLIHATDKAEHVLEDLTFEQITLIEQTIRRIKKRKLSCQKEDDDDYVPTPTRRSLPRTASTRNTNSRHEPTVEIRDGIEWVSFVYSHNRVLKRYSIRTDIQTVALDSLDEQFKLDNCVYPRAHLPKETYRGNRWNYETECNRLGWKLAWLNKSEIAGKRGLIQRAVDSYRNRSPSMRSRRVARQAKLLNGTLRKRKHQPAAASPPSATSTCMDEEMENSISATEREQLEQQYEEDHMAVTFPSTLAAATVKSAHSPKTLIMTDDNEGRYRIKINVENVVLEVIPEEFRKVNCVFPRAMTTAEEHYNDRRRWIEETMCNELGWKLAWLNQRYLAGKKNLLQRAIDIYRIKFMPALQPRKTAASAAPQMPPIVDTSSPSSPSSCSSTAESSLDEDPMMLPAQFLSAATSVPADFATCFVDDMMLNMAIEPSFVTPPPFAPAQIPMATIEETPFAMDTTSSIPTPTTTTTTISTMESEDDKWLKFEQEDFGESAFLSYDALF
ncbi:hypothetical protein BDB00DRAFT_788636 [Zychaea mexicana]|uniref:uncharacterized protein n=1 Tax=Zychaea mexicana TaxID=64656 RepID=UPI0022FE1D1B|nr:uncharacterized protein BDB00DRAFT_788636 [Zychaea mexicana]KAI9492649.1 hypothetical protein BDB00DRAFT_788636 [Zychaea mexicana]